ncbi:MAG: iron ABC transporter permease [Pseudomonadota bacterium]
MKPLKLYLIASAGVGLIFLAALFIGTTPMSLTRFFRALIGAGEAGDMIVLWEIRAPRTLAAFVVGASLGASGAALQGLLRNPLAEPGVLGVSACSALGGAVALFYGAASAASLTAPLAAVVGALAATIILTLAAQYAASVVTLILIGVGLSSFAGAVMALLLNLAPNPFSLAEMMSWTLGSVANRSYGDIALAAPFLAVGGVCIASVARSLSALTLGEASAYGLGVNLERTRILTVLGASLMTGASVSIAGAIGFIGLVAPHMVRPLVGHDPARTIGPAALLGGAVLIVADMGVRLIPTTTELRLGVLAALIGAPAFVWIAMRSRARYG